MSVWKSTQTQPAPQWLLLAFGHGTHGCRCSCSPFSRLSHPFSSLCWTSPCRWPLSLLQLCSWPLLWVHFWPSFPWCLRSLLCVPSLSLLPLPWVHFWVFSAWAWLWALQLHFALATWEHRSIRINAELSHRLEV